MTTSHGSSSAARTHLSDTDFINLAASQGGRSADDLSQEFHQLAVGSGRITAEEYVMFGLYDSRRHTYEEKCRFISDRLHWPIVWSCCDMSWQATTEDKWHADRLLSLSGVPVPKVLAVLDCGHRIYPRTTTIRSLDQFSGFLRDWKGQPFFAKPIRGLQSVGILRCERYDGNLLYITGRGEVRISDLYHELTSRQPYILQPVVRNHNFFEGMCSALATVRIGALVYDNLVTLAFCFLKMPGPGNLEDRFHPVGNLACGLNPDTGDIISIRRRTEYGATSHQVLPEGGLSIIGRRLPWWKEILELVAFTARLFAPVRYQTMDIAITGTGPVIIEVNTGGGFGGPQLVMERGLLQGCFLNFLTACRIDVSRLTLPSS